MAEGTLILGGIIVVFIALFIYSYVIRPKPIYEGMYLNPKGRRRVTEIHTPDAHGIIRGVINEEGTKEMGQGYVTIVVDSEGYTFKIPHVMIERDCRFFNMKQALAGYDAPLAYCCVDKDGIRHPEFLDSLTTPTNMITDIKTADLEKENMRLRMEVAKTKNNLDKVSQDEEFFDKMNYFTDHISRLRQTMLRWAPEGDREGEFDDERK